LKDKQDNDKKKDEKANNDQQNIPTDKTKQKLSNTNTAKKTTRRFRLYGREISSGSSSCVHFNNLTTMDSGYTEGQSVPVPLVASMSTI
jgi:hypothetical protein